MCNTDSIQTDPWHGQTPRYLLLELGLKPATFLFFSDFVFCPVTVCYGNMNFPLTQPITTPLRWPSAGGVAWPRAPCAPPSPGAGEQQRRTEHGARASLNRRVLESCHVPLQMWKRFSGRLRDFVFSSQTTLIKIQQKRVRSQFVYSLLNTVMVPSCIAGGPFAEILLGFYFNFLNFAFVIEL